MEWNEELLEYLHLEGDIMSNVISNSFKYKIVMKSKLYDKLCKIDDIFDRDLINENFFRKLPDDFNDPTEIEPMLDIDDMLEIILYNG